MTQKTSDKDIIRKYEDLERKVGKEEISKVGIIIGEGYPTIWSTQVEILEKLYYAILEQQTFEVAYGGAVALPRSSFSVGAQVKTDMSEQHKAEYCRSIEQKLREYVRLIIQNKTVNKSYQVPLFTEEKATEIAQEAFEESFRRTRKSYQVAKT